MTYILIQPSINNYVIVYCSSLTSISIQNSVTLIGNYVLEGCSSLMSVSIPKSQKSIDLGIDCKTKVTFT